MVSSVIINDLINAVRLETPFSMPSYRMDFKEFVIKARPNIKENSVHAYARSLRLLAPEDAISLDFLRDTETIIAKLDK